MDDLGRPQGRYHEIFMLISLLEVCQEGGIKNGGTWRMLRVPDQTLRTGSFLTSWMTLVDPKEDTLKFSCWYLYWKCVKKGGSRRGVLGGHWGFLTGDLEDSHPWCHKWYCLTLRKIPWKFRVDIFIKSVSRMGGQEGGYLEDVDGSWPETWRTGSSFMS